MTTVVKETLEDRRREIVGHPEKHSHSYDALIGCCMYDGAVNGMLMEAHEGNLGTNGGRRCDVNDGPCSCGAWH